MRSEEDIVLSEERKIELVCLAGAARFYDKALATGIAVDTRDGSLWRYVEFSPLFVDLMAMGCRERLTCRRADCALNAGAVDGRPPVALLHNPERDGSVRACFIVDTAFREYFVEMWRCGRGPEEVADGEA